MSRDAYYIGGIHAIKSALLSERPISKIFISSESNRGRIKEVLELAKERGILTQESHPKKLDEMVPDARHQGIVALTSPITFSSVDDMLQIAKEREEAPLLVIVDGVEDPRNLGAIIRSAEAFGAHGVIVPKRSSSPITSVTAKASAGALERVAIAQIGNVSQELERLKERGLWIAGLTLEDSVEINKEKLDGALAIVLGNEGKGVSRLVRKNCDFLLRIPMLGEVGSLNVSVAAGVALYEIRRQRQEA